MSADKRVSMLFVVCLLAGPARPQDWPSFRGPNASGLAAGANPPLRWDAEAGRNVRWRTLIPGLGHSSPVVVGDRVFLTTAVALNGTFMVPHGLTGDMLTSNDNGPQAWIVMCLDVNTGAVRWQKVVYSGFPRSRRHPMNSYATPTPAVSSDRVVVSFGSEGLYCFSLNGELIWKRDLGALNVGSIENPDFQWGYASSPVIYHNRVIVQCDRDHNPFIATFRLSDGTQIWRTRREDLPSWSTPTIVEWRGKAQVVTLAPSFVRGYDLRTGQELWRLYWGLDTVECTPIATDGVIYFSAGRGRTGPILAVRANAKGDITLNGGQESNEFVIWSRMRGGGLTTTPILMNGYLYVLTNLGILRCFEAHTGKLIYEQRVGPADFLAAPVAAAGRIYLTSQEGEIFVIRDGPKFELLATNSMGDICQATPAMLHDKILIRTRGALYAIQEGAEEPKISFRDVTREAGLEFRSLPPLLDPRMRHINSLWANFIAGVAVGDFDGDGFDDIFVVASRLGEKNKLYRNRGDMTFEECDRGNGASRSQRQQ